jgi:hypothetical protein
MQNQKTYQHLRNYPLAISSNIGIQFGTDNANMTRQIPDDWEVHMRNCHATSSIRERSAVCNCNAAQGCPAIRGRGMTV